MTTPKSTRAPHGYAPSAGWDDRHWRRAVYRATTITPAQRVLALQLQDERTTWGTGGTIYASEETLAAAFGKGTDRTTIRGHMKALLEAGWLIRTREATTRTPAHYRLGYGEYAMPAPETLETPTSQAAQTLETPTSDVGNANVQTLGTPTRSSTRSSSPSSSLSPEAHDDVAEAARTEEQREIAGISEESTTTPHGNAETVLRALMAFWPNKGCRRGTARENALAQIETTLNKGIDTADLVDAGRDAVRSGDVDSRSWLNAWIAEWEKTNATVAQVSARFTREARIHACTLCDEYGFINAVDQRGIRTSSRCTHPDVDDTAVAAEAPRRTREFTQRTEQYIDPTNPWKTAPLITSDDYDADDGDDYAPPAGWGIGA